MTVAAGVFLALFGGLGAWFLAKRFPSAQFLRAGYVMMSLGGVFFVVWAVSKSIALGVTAAALLGLGGALGVVGALRRELRFLA